MIRINLGRTRIQNIEELESGLPEQPVGGQNSMVQNLLKVAVILIGVVALHFYESGNLDQLSLQVAQVSQELQSMQMTLDQKNQELASMGSLEQESKVLQDKMKLLKKLSQLRLREVKSLDYLQTVIPPRIWLTSLKIDQSSYVLRGRSQDEPSITLFVDKLEDGGYFSDVILIQDSPVEERNAELRAFEIVARSEVFN